MTAVPQAGPFRLPVHPDPFGARMDVGHFLAHLLRELADQARGNGDSVLDELVAIADADSAARRDALVDALIDRIGGSELHLTPQQAARLAAELARAAQPGAPTVTPISGKAAA